GGKHPRDRGAMEREDRSQDAGESHERPRRSRDREGPSCGHRAGDRPRREVDRDRATRPGAVSDLRSGEAALSEVRDRLATGRPWWSRHHLLPRLPEGTLAPADAEISDGGTLKRRTRGENGGAPTDGG